jgi:hypothetical protein
MKLKPYRREPSPLVEAVTKHPGNWTIQDLEWGGKTNNKDHEMWVPLDDEPCIHCGTPHGDAIRGHELLHAKLSPETFSAIKVVVGDAEIKVSDALVEVAEEYRVNHSLAKIEGKTLIDTGWCSPSIEELVHVVMDQGRFTEVIKLAVAGGPGADAKVTDHLVSYQKALKLAAKEASVSVGAKKQMAKKQKVAEVLTEAVSSYSSAAARIMKTPTRSKTLPSWAKTEQLAAFLEVNLREFNNQLKALFAEPVPDLAKLDRFLGDQPEGSLNPEATVVKHGEKLVMGESSALGPEAVRWGTGYKITEAKMPLTLAPWKLQKANRAVEEGTIPRYMHRWPTDKRVFHRSKRLPGGTLLVDDSGSMGLNPQQLEAIIETAPAATVAVYAGRDQDDGGEIRVVAKDGKRAKTEDLSILEFGGNGIDGPALEWLGSQPYPRIWITDGGVTDKRFGFGWQTVEAAKRLVVKHKVTVAESAEEAAEIMKHRRFAR